MATKKTSSKSKTISKGTDKPRSMREHAAKTRDKAESPRRLKQATNTAGKPIRAFGQIIKAVLRPFKFLLLPFKTRPARFVGRVISKILFLSYFIASWQELRKVTWPGAKLTTKLSFAVIIFATIFGLFVALVDFLLDKIFRSILV